MNSFHDILSYTISLYFITPIYIYIVKVRISVNIIIIIVNIVSFVSSCYK